MDRNSGRYLPRMRRSFMSVSVSERLSGLSRIERNADAAAGDVLTSSPILHPRTMLLRFSENTAWRDGAIANAVMIRDGLSRHVFPEAGTRVLPMSENGPSDKVRSYQRRAGLRSTASDTIVENSRILRAWMK